MGRQDFQSLSVQVAAWLSGREVLQSVGSYKRGHWAVAPTRGHIAKAWVCTCPLKLQCPLVQGDTLPQKKGGAVQAVVSSVSGHWAPENYVNMD